MSFGTSNDGDDEGRLSLKRAGLPERFGKRSSMERSYRGDHRRRSALYDDWDVPTTKYDLMTSAERREEQARIEADVKQVEHIGLVFTWRELWLSDVTFIR